MNREKLMLLQHLLPYLSAVRLNHKNKTKVKKNTKNEIQSSVNNGWNSQFLPCHNPHTKNTFSHVPWSV
jgi:hypothetical protein